MWHALTVARERDEAESGVSELEGERERVGWRGKGKGGRREASRTDMLMVYTEHAQGSKSGMPHYFIETGRVGSKLMV